MPNWITNKVTAAPHVIQMMIDAENKRIDFNRLLPYQGQKLSSDGIRLDVEDAAHLAVHGKRKYWGGEMRAIEDDNAKEDLKRMIDNFNKTGYLHSMDFATEEWGTKWNACDSTFDVAAGRAQFDTAWSCPIPVFIKLSALAPEETINVVYADEDTGYNCGTMVLKNGEIFTLNCAPSNQEDDEAVRRYWRLFAYGVKGYSDEEIKECEDERESDE